ncbi:DUF429 domain-containing protein [Pseudalkalibacillus hwajinpoensis]|uniref:DUF429 domain-containing protein n=1 Tax=Guptibacillus hwajinpoensis TaxID=208199 RepID=A0A4U1MIW9_9BACL|nr:DUF429 domain-containing protein [Pseudalkalibacillus hwajinpoensis]TKD70504.1 DUF429 domain-containing protein [Pseudalkalibacillus hwajinpoensis]
MTIYVGIDLSGPSNTKETSIALFKGDDSHLTFQQIVNGVTDEEIYELLQEQTDSVVIGIDAPLSYQPGGGDRKADRALRKEIIAKGMKSGSIMTPTMTRMVYLTLRGITLSRGLSTTTSASIVEVHPGAAVGLRSPDLSSVLTYKLEIDPRHNLKAFLEKDGVKDIPTDVLQSSHSFDACLAAYAAWKWKQDKSEFLYPAEPPFHPFPVSC